MQSDPLSEAFDHARLGRFDAAEERLNAVLAARPDNASADHLLGVIRAHQGRMDDALLLIRRASSSPAATAEMHASLGAVLYRLGQTHEAIDAYERALAV